MLWPIVLLGPFISAAFWMGLGPVSEALFGGSGSAGGDAGTVFFILSTLGIGVGGILLIPIHWFARVLLLIPYIPIMGVCLFYYFISFACIFFGDCL